jgi:hypothetical protein
MDASPPTAVAPQKPKGIQIINAGLWRTGSKSMALAYARLGFKAHHGLNHDMMDEPWDLLEKAAEATFPKAPGARPHSPFQRVDWDELWGSHYDVVTDMAAPFVFELLKAYPEAKVVIVQRPFEDWWPSFHAEILNRIVPGPPGDEIAQFLGQWGLGIRVVHATRKSVLGFFRAQNRGDIFKNAKTVYEEYYDELRRVVPAERRLEYKLGDGWDPLCEFLGVEPPGPNVPFPRVNDRAERAAGAKKDIKRLALSLFRREYAIPFLVAVTAIFLFFKLL